MGVFNRAIDLIVIYKIIKQLNTDWKNWEIYKLGLIDEKGKLIKKPETFKEKQAYSYFIRFIRRLKMLLEKITFSNKVGNLFISYLMLRESNDENLNEVIEILEKNNINVKLFFKEYFKNYLLLEKKKSYNK